jgi:hypothetical protein
MKRLMAVPSHVDSVCRDREDRERRAILEYLREFHVAQAELQTKTGRYPVFEKLGVALFSLTMISVFVALPVGWFGHSMAIHYVMPILRIVVGIEVALGLIVGTAFVFRVATKSLEKGPTGDYEAGLPLMTVERDLLNALNGYDVELLEDFKRRAASLAARRNRSMGPLLDKMAYPALIGVSACIVTGNALFASAGPYFEVPALVVCGLGFLFALIHYKRVDGFTDDEKLFERAIERRKEFESRRIGKARPAPAEGQHVKVEA